MDLLDLSYSRFMAYVYNVPYSEPDVLDGYSRAEYSEIAQLLDSQQIVRIELKPLMQPFAGPPGTQNRILNFQTSEGRKLFAKVRYDLQTRQIFPPI